MQDRFDRKLKELLPKPGRVRLLAAVSGGADSMCLLYLLCNSRLSPDITVAHMNFCLRGADSEADQAHVEEWCRARGLRLRIKRADAAAYAREYGVSVEMAARNLRYGWFEELVRTEGLDGVAVAHHADDNAETLLLNLVRGTGLKGLGGMQETNGRIIRPMLAFGREEIDRFVQERGIPFRTDRTNAESEYARNRIRNEVFPQLRKINPSVVQTLNRDMRHFYTGRRILDRLAEEKRRELLEVFPGTCAGASCGTFSGASSGMFPARASRTGETPGCAVQDTLRLARIDAVRLLQEEFYPYWLYELLQPYGFRAAETAAAAAALADRRPGVKVFRSPSCAAVLERGFLTIYPAELLEEEIAPVVIAREDPGEPEWTRTFRFGHLRVRLTRVTEFPGPEEGFSLAPGVLYVSADRLRFPLVCRPFRPGDRFCPLGMRGGKKVSDFLTDRKVPFMLRPRIPLLLSGTGGPDDRTGLLPAEDPVFCIAGMGIGQAYRIDASTRSALRIETIPD